MTSKNAVVWKEGLLVAPQHFQQQQRYIDYVLNFKLGSFSNFGYGFKKLVLDQELLKLGRIGIKEAFGIMPDGTPFIIPYQDIAPQPILVKQIGAQQAAQVYLSLPITSDAISEIDNASNEASLTSYRYHKDVFTAKDVHTKDGDYLPIEVAKLAPKLMQGLDDLSAFSSLALCRIKEVRSDGSLILDDSFIPTVLSIDGAHQLQSFLEECNNLISERAKQLAERIGSPTAQGVAGIAEFLMLQLLNAAKPLYQHFVNTKLLHPEEFYLMLSKTCSELLTFTSESRAAPSFKYYDHNDLTATFKPLIVAMRQALSIVLTPRAVSISLSKQNNVYIGVINETELFKTANFVLAVKTNLPQEQLIRVFSQQTKIASPLLIDNLIRVQLAGISLLPLASAPPALPFYAGYTYFQLDSGSKGWDEIIKTSSIAFHIAGNFAELDMQLWAIRDK